MINIELVLYHYNRLLILSFSQFSIFNRSRPVADFLEERRVLLENVGPELQNQYDSTGLEVRHKALHVGQGYLHGCKISVKSVCLMVKCTN